MPSEQQAEVTTEPQAKAGSEISEEERAALLEQAEELTEDWAGLHDDGAVAVRKSHAMVLTADGSVPGEGPKGNLRIYFNPQRGEKAKLDPANPFGAPSRNPTKGEQKMDIPVHAYVADGSSFEDCGFAEGVAARITINRESPNWGAFQEVARRCYGPRIAKNGKPAPGRTLAFLVLRDEGIERVFVRAHYAGSYKKDMEIATAKAGTFTSE